VSRAKAGFGIFLAALLAALLLTACTADTTATTAGPSTTAPSTSTTLGKVKGGSVTVQGLAVFEGPDGSKGGIIEFTTTVEPGTSGKVAVGMLEGEVFGTGSQWRVAGWTSALAASSLLNLDLADYRISHEVDGRVDGPSAGALMTVATLAAFLGDKVDSKVTMTGTINPDFTVGPVGGIPLKLQAAAKAGKTAMLVPLGQRVQQDPNTGELVDLVEAGKALGVDVREVGDVYAAYEAFTGQRLPRPMVVDREPKLTAKADATVMGQTASWSESCLQQLDEFDALPAEVKTEYETGRVKYANEALADADQYMAQGIAGGAYFSAVEAARQAALGVNYSRLEQDMQKRGEYVAGKALSEADVSGSLDRLGDELLAAKPAGTGEAASLLEAWGYWTVATRLAGEADSLIESLPKGDEVEGRLDSIYTAVWDYTLAAVARDSARDALELGTALRGEPLREPERLPELAEAYRRAAEANLDTIDVVVIPGLAEAWGVSTEEALATLRQSDVNYAEADAAVSAMDYLRNSLEPGPSRDLAVLGAALVAYADSACSLAERYSLAAEYDEDGDIIGYANEKALVNDLDFAEERAREMISLAAKGRADAALPTLYYQSGNLLGEGAPADKLDALYDYWTASLIGHVMAVLGGRLEPLAPR